MNALLDTHIVLWWLSDDPQLSDMHRRTISGPDNLCFISAATVWEISIKSSIGKLNINDNYLDELESEGFMELPVTWQHCRKVRELPAIHSDPFDRLLIAQAKLENMTLLTADENIKKYNVIVE